MASSFRETNRALSRLLYEEARSIGVFDHPTAKGDGREELLRRFLSDRVGTTFGVSKAEVVDSNGRTSGELDVVIYDQRATACLSVLGERRIVRAEAVVATIEVKSEFSAGTLGQEWHRVRDGIGTLTRFFRPAPLLTILKHAMPPEKKATVDALFANGLSTLADHAEIPAVVSCYFGFKGPSEEAARNFIETPMLDAVCVLGQYTIAKKRVGFNKRANGTDDALAYVWGRGDDALGAFLQLLETALHRALDARTLVQPAPRYYDGEELQRAARDAAAASAAPTPPEQAVQNGTTTSAPDGTAET